jgi:FkbM family methyltransferase
MLRSKAFQAINRVLAHRNLALLRLDRQFGIQVLPDLRRIAGAWGYKIDTLFDVGANEGQTAVNLLREFPETQVFSFEPHPSTFAKLLVKFENNPRFHGVNVALGAEAGEVEMIEYPNSKINSLVSNAGFATRYREGGKSIPVKAMKLDVFCEENSIDNIVLLKIDTEGFELMVLRGAEKMLSQGKIKFVYAEYNDLQGKEGVFGGALAPIDALLRSHGYRFVASYNDYVRLEGEMFSVSNALFALPPQLADQK